MKRILSLLFGIMLCGSFLLNFPLKTLADDGSTTVATKGSLVLDGWAEEPIADSNQPIGPQGNSSLNNYNEGNGARKTLPQTNTSSNLILSHLGLTLLMLTTFFMVSRKRLAYSKKEVIK